MRQETVLWLPMPPSVNNLFATFKKRRISTERYTEWRTAAGVALNQQAQVKRILGPVALNYSIGTDTKSDLGNLEKALTDFLVSSALIESDDKRTVRALSMTWGDHEGVNVAISGVA